MSIRWTGMGLRCPNCKQMRPVVAISTTETRRVVIFDLHGGYRRSTIRIRIPDRLEFVWHQDPNKRVVMSCQQTMAMKKWKPLWK